MKNWLTKNLELVELVGRGGSGDVWKAHYHGRNGAAPEIVAVKRSFGEATPEECERLFGEARILEKMRHQGIVRFHSLGFSEAREPYLAMEFVHGPTLDAYRQGFPGARLPEEVARSFARQLASMIQYISTHTEERLGQRRYLVHGDLKPRNLIVAGGGQLKLLDFGSARRVNPEVTNTLSGVERTMGYSAPEVDEGEASRITELFSLGAIYFELLTGCRVLDGDSIPLVLEARRKFYVRSRVAARRKRLEDCGVSEPERDLVLGLLSKQRRERERSYLELLAGEASPAPVVVARAPSGPSRRLSFAACALAVPAFLFPRPSLAPMAVPGPVVARAVYGPPYIPGLAPISFTWTPEKKVRIARARSLPSEVKQAEVASVPPPVELPPTLQEPAEEEVTPLDSANALADFDPPRIEEPPPSVLEIPLKPTLSERDIVDQLPPPISYGAGWGVR